MIHIEVFDGDDRIQTRTAGTRPFTYQQAYLYQQGQRFPLAFQIPMKETDTPFPVGHYTLSPDSLVINQYKALEVSRFRISLIPLPKPKAKEPAK